MSMPLDRGWWFMSNGQRRLLTYWSDSGAVTLDGPGGLDVLAVCHNEDDFHRRITGWEDHCQLRNGLAWLTGQLDGCR